MATTVTHNYHQDGSHQAAVSSHGPVPGSPTLTNPDMILPDYEFPDSPQGRSQSPLMSWRDPGLDQLDFQLPPSTHHTGSTYNSPTTPIIYGNGTMLSDIGEVTEVESTVGLASRRASSRYSGHTEHETYGPANGAPQKAPIFQRRTKNLAARERRASIESTSTITTQDHRGTFGDFDDSVSVDDSNFQGDDEESMASSYVEGTIPRSARIRNTVEPDGDENYSTSYISNRAEKILANAKRRLTAMEGNLSRARTSLGSTDGSTPSPQMGRPAGSTVRESATSQPTNHNRIKSEDGIREAQKQPTLHLQRSASALGAAGGYRQPSSRSKREEPGLPTNRPVYGISHHPLDTGLEPLSEDDGQDMESNPDSVRYSGVSNYLSPTFGGSEDRLTRSHSVMQMRDIQDQMQGLKGKISTLKEQARADSMKRRSLQSLRTPSPFTHATWDQSRMEPREIRAMDSREPTPTNEAEDEDGRQTPTGQMMEAQRQAQAAAQEEQKSSGSERQRSWGSQENRSTPTQGHTAENSPKSVVEQPLEDDMRTENGDFENEQYEEDEFNDARSEISDWQSDGGDSLYHDSEQHQMSHEDREDAFDYEHFFLHSAMGSISRQSRRESDDSDYSDDSVETTRGPTSRMSSKRRSIDTTASDETFATATEGRASRSSAFKGDMGGFHENGYDELPPLQEVGSNDGTEEINGVNPETEVRHRHNSVVYRPTSASHADRLHRPSISSFESTGTNRSFPLVNKAKMNGGVLTPGGSPDPVLRQMSETLLKDTASVLNEDGGSPPGPSAAAMQGLAKDDQIAVERLVASLGKCVLGLGETSRAGTESREFRRRIDAARRILERQDES